MNGHLKHKLLKDYGSKPFVTLKGTVKGIFSFIYQRLHAKGAIAMETTANNTKDIEITSVYFKNGLNGLESYPKSMVWGGQEYSFIEEALRYLITTRDQLVQLFDVSDGRDEYRLRLDNANHWTLVGIKSGAVA